MNTTTTVTERCEFCGTPVEWDPNDGETGKPVDLSGYLTCDACYDDYTEAGVDPVTPHDLADQLDIHPAAVYQIAARHVIPPTGDHRIRFKTADFVSTETLHFQTHSSTAYSDLTAAIQAGVSMDIVEPLVAAMMLRGATYHEIQTITGWPKAAVNWTVQP